MDTNHKPNPFRQARLAAKLSQIQLSAKSGVYLPAIRMAEKHNIATEKTVYRLAFALGIPPASLQAAAPTVEPVEPEAAAGGE